MEPSDDWRRHLECAICLPPMRGVQQRRMPPPEFTDRPIRPWHQPPLHRDCGLVLCEQGWERVSGLSPGMRGLLSPLAAALHLGHRVPPLPRRDRPAGHLRGECRPRPSARAAHPCPMHHRTTRCVSFDFVGRRSTSPPPTDPPHTSPKKEKEVDVVATTFPRPTTTSLTALARPPPPPATVVSPGHHRNQQRCPRLDPRRPSPHRTRVHAPHGGGPPRRRCTPARPTATALRPAAGVVGPPHHHQHHPPQRDCVQQTLTLAPRPWTIARRWPSSAAAAAGCSVSGGPSTSSPPDDPS